ncbi:MAG: hypothetical protein HFJ33_04535 [Clostridia bacterium]|nr:hypothetical protein [Clostridia bacterium]
MLYKEKPTANITLVKNEIFLGLPFCATVTLKDEKSGINLENSRWTCSPDSQKIGTNENLYQGTFEEEVQKITLPGQEKEGKYYVHVLVSTFAGELEEFISEPVQISHAPTR